MFTVPLTPVDEYWVGYFRADGSLSRQGTDGVNAVFAQARFHPVREFADFVGQKSVRSRLMMTNFGVGMIHRVTSAQAGRALDMLGAKTDLLEPLYASRDFWRGMIDGDGCLGIYTKPSGRKQPMINLTGRLADVTKLGEYFTTITGRIPPKTVNVSGAFRISFSGNAAMFLVNHLYELGYSANVQKQIKARAIGQLPMAVNTCAWSPR